MLKLQHLEVSGFKSFCDPVTVEFAGGITAIVGPNGCGKSNLAEAMTWVLGEQSAKSLRGGTMEDVIFGGSEQRKPLGLAEVGLTLETDPATAGTEDGRVTLGRRVFRTGESQYRLNGKVVRLKDVKDLLMDTGLGIRAYSVIEQGKIGMILSGKPQERRKLLEEAAGITRYKARKRIAEVKLEEATANLLRLDDVISEVERALRSLKRQANAARRYKQAETEYRELLRLVLQGRWAALQHRLSEVRVRLEETVSREASLAADLHRDEAELAAGRERQEELAAAVAERHRRQAELDAIIEGRQQLAKGNRQTLEEIRERTAQSRALAERRDEEIRDTGGRLAELASRRDELAAELSEASSEVTRDEEKIAGADRELSQAAARVETLRAQLLERLGEIEQLRNRSHQADIELEKGNYRRNHLDTEIEEHHQEVAQAEEAVAVAGEQVSSLEKGVEERSGELEKVEAALEVTLRREAEASERRRSLEQQLSEARQRQRLLAELSQAHAERRARLEEALAEIGLGEAEFLVGRLQAVEGWERSLDLFLSGLADAVLLDTGSDPLRLAGELGERRVGAVLVQPLERMPDTFPTLDDPAVVLSLGEALGLSEELAAALPPAFLVEDPADARRLARQHPGVTLLSRRGLWAAGGILHVEAERAVPGVLERERELGEIGERMPRLEKELGEAGESLERLVAQRADRARESNRLEGEIAQLKQELAVARARLEDAHERQRRLATEHAELLEERGEIERELARAAENRERSRGELAGAEERHRELEETFDRAQAELETAKEARESLRTESAGRRGHLDLLRERLESHDREVRRLTASIEEWRRQVGAWNDESARLDRRRAELEAAIEKAEAELQRALEERAGSEDDLRDAQERLAEHRRGLAEREARIAQAREHRDTVRSQVEELRVEQAGLVQNTGHLAGDFRDHFGEEIGEAPAAAEGELEPHALAEQEAALARNKATLDRLGPVNLLAVEEYTEQEERHAFLTAQRADVAASVESLKQTIREINQTSSERFAETFAEVNRAFGDVFERLFRGGEAEMHLLDEEDVLESGIEIVARPPGKRLQNITLLSGGEKALTAIALLFALFRSKPSPFCILDEVDAPLDDVNTVRFVELLREMVGETQFIVITHNKITMEAASTLYGVTMEEKGVSKLVSVEIEDIQPEPQAATA